VLQLDIARCGGFHAVNVEWFCVLGRRRFTWAMFAAESNHGSSR
jgi:hypothetical protein